MNESEKTSWAIPIHRSLVRPKLLLGCERTLILSSMMVAGLIFLSRISFMSFFIALIFWLVCLALLQRMAKIDPKLSSVYMQSLTYKKYYPARSGLYARPKKIKDWRK